MTKVRWLMSPLVLALVLMIASCTQMSKPTDPAEFAESWLSAITDLDSDSNCDRVTSWLSDETRQTWYSGDCQTIRKNIEADLGSHLTKEVTFDCTEATRPSESEQGQIRLECAGSVPAAVFLVGSPGDWKVYAISPN